MEYVQGADLATLLQREPKLPLPRVLALARQIASGLAAAHRAGIVHRDLKPANVMVDAQEHALLMDFGIARSTSAARVHTDARLADRHPRLHGAGAGARRAGGRTDRCLRLRADPLRAARRRAAAIQRRRRALEPPRDGSRRGRRRCDRCCPMFRPRSSGSSTSACPRARRRGIRARTSCSPSWRRSTKKDAHASPVRARPSLGPRRCHPRDRLAS